MIDTGKQLEQLEGLVSRQEAARVQLEGEITELERSLDTFRVRYIQVVQPLVERLETTRRTVAQMERSNHERDFRSEDILHPRDLSALVSGIKPRPADVSAQAKTELIGDSRLKNLYYPLVRRFHPDLAPDMQEKAQRNQLLTLINEAYAHRDLTTLETLTKLSDSQQSGRQQPLSTAQLWQIVHLSQLEQLHGQLTITIEQLTQVRDSLLHSGLMQLKTEADIAQQQGRDLLREIANNLEKDHQATLAHLDQLRRQPGTFAEDETHPARPTAGQGDPTLALYLSVAGRDQEIGVQLKPGERAILGRAVTQRGVRVVDLTAYGAQEFGVSREHAALTSRSGRSGANEVCVTDMGSLNGSYLNGERLILGVAHAVSDGAEIRLGSLRLHIFYTAATARFLGKVCLSNLAAGASWTTNQRAWVEALKLALNFGWSPALGKNDMSYWVNVEVSQNDAQALAAALERAVPNLAGAPPKAEVKRLDSQRIEPPIWYFGGEAGKQKIGELIGFCRQGAFKVEID